MFDLIPRLGRGEMQKFRSEWDGLFDRLFGRWPAWSEEETVWPSMDVSESKDKYTITAELPGIEEKDLDISLEGDVLTIKGEKKKEYEEKEENVHRIERSYGRFVRSLRLPGQIDPEKVKAKYKKGVLTLTIPKSKEAVGRKIEIKAS
ncbi:MAG: Hsp20/alpha crystallin family protein [Deltaproteobacteria bacterium]|nr:Hsp20/alpha crystallin family protein [Deltaproteobacteria bacterium]